MRHRGGRRSAASAQQEQARADERPRAAWEEAIHHSQIEARQRMDSEAEQAKPQDDVLSLNPPNEPGELPPNPGK